MWVAFKVGALSYGGGFVIIPLMQGDAVDRYHWMTNAQFLNAVALGQVTPGPVVLTVAVVGYAAAGVGGGLLAAAIAFAPSFAFILAGAPRFERLRNDRRARAFLNGAGPAAIGAIIGAAIPLALALQEVWQYVLLAGAAVALLLLRRSVGLTLVGAVVNRVLAVHLDAPVRTNAERREQGLAARPAFDTDRVEHVIDPHGRFARAHVGQCLHFFGEIGRRHQGAVAPRDLHEHGTGGPAPRLLRVDGF